MDQEFDAELARIAATQPAVAMDHQDDDLADAASILVAETAIPMIGRLPRLLIVAGAQNYYRALDAAPGDTVVVGIQSAREWRDVQGAPNAELDRFIARGATEVVLAMGDVESSYDANMQAGQLARHLDTLGTKGAVRHIDTGAAELAAVLATRPDERGKSYLAGLMNAAGKLPRRPAAPKEAAGDAAPRIAPTVDVDRGITYVGSEAGIIMNAAAVRLRTYRIIDDLKDPSGENVTHMHDLSVTWMKDGVRQEREIPSVPDAQLANPRKWLNRLPGGTGLHYASMPGTVKEIESAIRAHDAHLVPEIPVYRRTGWVDLPGDGWSFLHPGGALTQHGNTQRSKAQIAKVMRSIVLKDTATAKPGEELAAARNAIAMMDEMSDLNIWVGMFGIAMHTVAGLGVGAVPGLFGKNGSGKSVVLQGITAYLSEAFGTDGKIMAAMDSSPKKISNLANGLDGLFIYFDDKREGESKKLAEQQNEALEYIVRPGYGGGSASPSTMVKSDTSESGWEPGEADLSSPARGLVGEEMPNGEKQNSTRERIYPMEIPAGFNIFSSGNARVWNELGAGALPSAHLAFFIRWVAEQMAIDGGKAPWVERWMKVRESLEDKRKGLGVSFRVGETGAVAETGMVVWAEYLMAIEAINEVECSDLLTRVEAVVTKTVQFHGTMNVNQQIPLDERILNSLRSAVISRLVTVERCTRAVGGQHDESWAEGVEGAQRKDYDTVSDRLPLQTFIGLERKGRGETGYFIALQPRDVLGVLRKEPQFAEMTERELFRAFTDVAIKDPGKTYKTVTVRGLRSQTLAIPTTLWMPGVELEEMPAPPAQ